MVQIIVPKLEEAKVGIDGKCVVLSTKSVIIKLPYQVVPTIARAMNMKAKEIDEIVNVHRLIGDQAFMMRSGAPFGLTNNPAIQKAAAHEAQFNDKLRKHLPGGVKGKSLIGTPTIIKHPSKEGGNGKDKV